jgi:hypothetical protein
VQRGDCASGIVVVALREDPAAQDVAGLRTELVCAEDVRGELALGRDSIEALHADWGLASGGEEEPNYAAQNGSDACRWRVLRHIRPMLTTVCL